jgi:hypothetical protein
MTEWGTKRPTRTTTPHLEPVRRMSSLVFSIYYLPSEFLLELFYYS